jgi:transcriptional regulator with PAS, ATPase and Fis domain
LKEDLFREDFYYRINVFSIHIPPLRDRPEDIPALADFFMQKYAHETGKRLEGLTQKALDILKAYPWPGNARELRNAIERVVVIARGRMVGAEELDFLRSRDQSCPSDQLTLKAAEMRHIHAALETSGWNISQAAKRLGIDRVTLSRKMKRHQIHRP